MNPIAITKENFQEKTAAGTVLLDFWAAWCGPCRMIAPIVEQIAGEREDILVGKIDVDAQPELAQKFGIVSIPTLVVLKNGQLTAKAVGYMPRGDVEKLLEK